MIKSSNLSVVDLSKELVLLDNVNLTFSSLLMRKGTQKVSSVLVNWKYENLDDSRGTALEGADISTFLSSNRSTGDLNVCQIIKKAVSISGTADAVTDEDIKNVFAHEINNRLLEAKRDLEYYLINGVYALESGSTPRQMRGLVNFVTNDNTITANNITIADLNDMSKIMRQAGTASQNLVLLCDYNTFDVVTGLYEDKTTYIGVTNEFGSPARKLNLKYGSAYIYLVDAMPQNTMILANMDYLKFGVLRPAQYQDLAKTGDSRKGFIVMENTLKVLNPNAATKFVLITDNAAPIFDEATLDASKKIVTLAFDEDIFNATANAAALKNSIKFAANGTNFANLASGDSVTIVDGKLVVTFASALTGSTNKVKVLANTLKDKSGNVITEDVTTDAIDATDE